MNTLNQQFNDQANWNISMLSLYMLIILDDIERRQKRHHAFVSKLQRGFQEASVQQSREQYCRQIADTHKPRRVAGPRP
jgi:hypothetical protein